VKLLIVDDSGIVRRTIERQIELQALGITEIFHASNGFEALDMFRRYLPDLVTMDITMPGMDGLTCVSRMIKEKPDTKLMVISALGDAETAIEAVERGANEYIFKPFTSEELNNALKSLLR
jgi:two-component system chemotaxis response regulator CheY